MANPTSLCRLSTERVWWDCTRTAAGVMFAGENKRRWCKETETANTCGKPSLKMSVNMLESRLENRCEAHLAWECSSPRRAERKFCTEVRPTRTSDGVERCWKAKAVNAAIRETATWSYDGLHPLPHLGPGRPLKKFTVTEAELEIVIIDKHLQSSLPCK